MFSNRIKEARERQKMTQKMLALRLGIAQTTVSGWGKRLKETIGRYHCTNIGYFRRINRLFTRKDR